MSSVEDVAQRVAAIETEPAVVRPGAAAAPGEDRDLAGYRAHTRTLGALWETQVEHYAEHKADAAEIKAGIAQIVHLLEGLGGTAS